MLIKEPLGELDLVDGYVYLFGGKHSQDFGKHLSSQKRLYPDQLRKDFGKNFHVRHKRMFARQKDRLVLVKGGKRSRLLS